MRTLQRWGRWLREGVAQAAVLPAGALERMTWLRSPRSLEFMRSAPRARARRAWLPRTSCLIPAGITALVLTVVALVEIKLSAVQSLVLPALASQLTWRLDRGASSRIVFPRKGPYDVASGYSSLPAFQQRLTTRGYRVVDQARFSKALAMAAAMGLTPPARDKTSTGLLISDERGHIEYDAVARQPQFSRYEQIPEVIVRIDTTPALTFAASMRKCRAAAW